MLLSETLAFCKKILLGEFPAPVGFCSFLEVSIDSHTREAKHGAEFEVSTFQWRGKNTCLRLNHLGGEPSIQCQLETNSVIGIDRRTITDAGDGWNAGLMLVGEVVGWKVF